MMGIIFDRDGRQIEIGFEVEVPAPDYDAGDIWNNEFVGIVDDIKEDGTITVRDQDDECWDIEAERVRVEE